MNLTNLSERRIQSLFFYRTEPELDLNYQLVLDGLGKDILTAFRQSKFPEDELVHYLMGRISQDQ